MQKHKLFLVLLLISTFSIGKSFIVTTVAEAFNGKPSCCLYLPAKLPSALYDAFGGAQPIEFKLFGRVKKIEGLSMSVSILALIDKALVKNVSSRKIVIDVSIPKYLGPKFSSIVPVSISDKDYVLLLPTKIYNKKLDEKMYDFVKIPTEMIK